MFLDSVIAVKIVSIVFRFSENSQYFMCIFFKPATSWFTVVSSSSFSEWGSETLEFQPLEGRSGAIEAFSWTQDVECVYIPLALNFCSTHSVSFDVCFYVFNRDPVYVDAKSSGHVFLNKRWGPSKDSSDFAICVMEGYADAKLPKSVPFSILLGDTGFEEIEEQFKSDVRHVRVINPHRQSALELVSLIMEDL